MNEDFEILRFTDTPHLQTLAVQAIQAGWSRFWTEDPVSRPLWPEIVQCFLPYHFGIVEKATGRLAAVGLTVPLAWDGADVELLEHGWHWVLKHSLADYHAGRTPHTLSAVNAVVLPEFRGYGLAEPLVREMQATAKKWGLSRFIAPLRPTQKHRYPLMDIADYMNWRNPDGSPFDAWLRLQTRLGAEIIGPARRSIVITAPLSDWSEWTGLEFPYPGDYIVPDAAVPLRVENGVGTLVSPSIWIVARP
ncbi:MAG: hypothetical protein Q4D98_10755 [Planctomycetia bacterium]|nr:hypothetical protein [Planctomycetia bacterium]